MRDAPDDIPPEITPEALAARLAAGEPTWLVDVREPWENEICALRDSVLVPVSEFPGAASALRPPPGALVVCYCHHGVRSLAAAAFLRKRGIAPGAVSLRGGIELWGRKVDRSIARY